MKKIHFIGIGGIGMSGLAEIALAKGARVTGSDLRPNNLTEKLGRRGAQIAAGHDPVNVPPDTTLVVKTTCIQDDNPELVAAKNLNIPVISRSEMLKEVLDAARVSIGISGTHGKTTTAGLIAHIMEYCGKDPTAIVGGELACFDSNVRYGKSGICVSEVDESDGFFRNINVKHAVVTNIEREHMEHFGSMENLINAYRQFINHVPSDGVLVFNGEDQLLAGIAQTAPARKVDFGLGEFTCTCKNLSFARSIQFDLVMRGRIFGAVKSPLVGRHNVVNILGAIALCMETGLKFKSVAEAVGRFQNVKRRFDLIGKIGTIEVIEDYAHHPTELKSVIKAARDYGAGRVITIFQPHRYSRTKDLAEDFLDCFYGSDVLILTDTYPADEDPEEGIGIRDIYEKIDKGRFETADFMQKKRIPEFVSALVRENDIVLVLGAGDIREISSSLINKIQKRKYDG